MQLNVATRCRCSVCGAEAVSIQGTSHRRCAGVPNAKPLSKHANRLGHAQKGVWQAG